MPAPGSEFRLELDTHRVHLGKIHFFPKKSRFRNLATLGACHYHPAPPEAERVSSSRLQQAWGASAFPKGYRSLGFFKISRETRAIIVIRDNPPSGVINISDDKKKKL